MGMSSVALLFILTGLAGAKRFTFSGMTRCGLLQSASRPPPT